MSFLDRTSIVASDRKVHFYDSLSDAAKTLFFSSTLFLCDEFFGALCARVCVCVLILLYGKAFQLDLVFQI